MKAFRNWIEEAIGKRWISNPVCVGRKHGRKYYQIDWEDGTSGDYYIDCDEHWIEEVKE